MELDRIYGLVNKTSRGFTVLSRKQSRDAGPKLFVQNLSEGFSVKRLRSRFLFLGDVSMG
jgi:hypothetical protein